MSPTQHLKPVAADLRIRPLGALSDIACDINTALEDFKTYLDIFDFEAAREVYTNLKETIETAIETIGTTITHNKDIALLDLRILTHVLHNMGEQVRLGGTSNLLLDKLADIAFELGGVSTEERNVLQLCYEDMVHSNPSRDVRAFGEFTVEKIDINRRAVDGMTMLSVDVYVNLPRRNKPVEAQSLVLRHETRAAC
jgi:hypothetical protein